MADEFVSIIMKHHVKLIAGDFGDALWALPDHIRSRGVALNIIECSLVCLWGRGRTADRSYTVWCFLGVSRAREEIVCVGGGRGKQPWEGGSELRSVVGGE